MTSQYIPKGLQGETSLSNSTQTPLASGATFTGIGEKNDYAQVGVMLKTDNTGTLFFDFSNDGSNWDSTFPVAGFKIAANISEFHTAVKLGRYFRLRLVNDTGAQSFLRLTTYYGNSFVPSSAPLNQSIGIDTDAINVRPNSYQDEVVIGRRTGVRHFTKFGYRTGLTASAGEQTVWATTTNFVPMTSADTFDITYTNTTDGSGQNGALTLFIDYVDENGLYAQTTHTLGSSGSDTTAFSGLGINRIAVASSGSTNTNGSEILLTETTSGNTQAVIPAMNGVTQQAIFHVDANSFAVARFLFIECNKLSGGGSPRVQVKAYIFNRNVQTYFEVYRGTLDTTSTTVLSINEPIGFKLSPTDILYIVADTDTNSTVINCRFSLNEYKID